MDREGALGLAQAVDIVSQIARSLSEAHARGVIHRDLKPENIFISHVEGEGLFVKVLDFGIAKIQQSDSTRITRLGYVCGTPEYMSPEQARGEEIDGGSDLYALGVLLWEMLEGRVPFEAPTPLGVVLKHQSDPVPELTVDVPEAVKRFIYRAMAKDRAERPHDAEAFLQSLREACPPDLEALSSPRHAERQRRLSEPPITPSAPMLHTDGISLAPTVETDLVDLDAPAPVMAPASAQRVRGLIWLAVAAGALLLGGVTIAAVLLSDDGAQAALSPATVGVWIEASPPGTMIFVNGERMGLAPARLEGAPGDAVKLELRSRDHFALATTLEFPEQDNTPRRFNLMPKPRGERVAITVETSPAGAAIVRAGEGIAVTPFTLDLDKHDAPFKVELRLAGHAPQPLLIDPVKGNQTLSLQLVAEAKAPQTSPRQRGAAVQKAATPREQAPQERSAAGEEAPSKVKPAAEPVRPKYQVVE